MNLKGKIIKASGKQYILKQQLSEGGFSIIYTTKNPQVICKVQVMDIPDIAKAFQKQKNILKALNHPNIVKLYDWSQNKEKDGNHGFLFLQNCSQGTIFNILQKAQGSIPQKKILQIFQAVSSALEEVHKNGLSHRDIKLQNILVNKNSQYKLCDFGSCTKDIIRMINNNNRVDIQQFIQKTTTPLYRSPEQLDLYSGFQIGPKVDIFAMGVLIFMMCFKKQPFQSRLSAINKQYFIPDQNPYSQQLMKLIQQCFTTDPDLRPSASEIKKKIKSLQKRKKALIQINLQKQFDNSFQELVKIKNNKFSSMKDNKNDSNANDDGIINKIKKIYNQITTQTQGWFVGFIQDTQQAPMLKYSRSIISKCWQKRYKVDKVYQILWKYWEQNKSKSFVVLKLLIFLHNFLRKGPSEALTYDKQNNPIKLATKIYNHWKISQKPTSRDDIKRNILICSLIKYYCLIIIQKSKFAYENSHLFQGNYSIIPYFNQKDQTIILKLPILQQMINLLEKCVNFHEILSKDEQNHSGRQIERSILWSLADQEYCLISSFVFLICAFKDALNYVKQNLDMKKITLKVNEIQQNFVILFKKLTILLQKTKNKTKQFFTLMQNQGLSLNQSALKHIQQIKFDNKKLSDFKITKHLNYQNNIGGLKIPFTYEEVVKNPTILSSAARKQSQIVNAIDVNQFKMSEKQKKQSEIKIEHNQNQNFNYPNREKISQLKQQKHKQQKKQQDKLKKPSFDQFTSFAQTNSKKQINTKKSQIKQSKIQHSNLMEFSHQNLNSDFFNPFNQTKSSSKKQQMFLGDQFFSVPSKTDQQKDQKGNNQFDSFLNFASHDSKVVDSKQKKVKPQKQINENERQKIKQKLLKNYNFSKDIYNRLNNFKKQQQQPEQQNNKSKNKIQIVNFSDDQDGQNEKQNKNKNKNRLQDDKQTQIKQVQFNYQEKNELKKNTIDNKVDQQKDKIQNHKKSRKQKKAQRAALRKQKQNQQKVYQQIIMEKEQMQQQNN